MNVLRLMLLGSLPMDFKSDYPFDETVKRLQDVTQKFSVKSLTSEQQLMIGTVSESAVKLERTPSLTKRIINHTLPLMKNVFNVSFKGVFQRTPTQAVLTGEYVVSLNARLTFAALIFFLVTSFYHFVYIPVLVNHQPPAGPSLPAASCLQNIKQESSGTFHSSNQGMVYSSGKQIDGKQVAGEPVSIACLMPSLQFFVLIFVVAFPLATFWHTSSDIDWISNRIRKTIQKRDAFSAAVRDE